MRFFKKLLHFVKTHKVISAAIFIGLIILILVFKPRPAPNLETQDVKRETLTESVSVSGTVGAKSEADLSFGATGKVTFLGAHKNDQVNKWQTIATEDTRAVEASIQSAADSYKNQQISYDKTYEKNGSRTLADTGLSVDARRELETAVNTLDQTQLAVEVQRIAQESSVLVSPIKGVLVRADVDTVGSIASLTTHFVVVDPTSLEFTMDVDEADIGKITVGQTVDVTLDAYPDAPLHMMVNSIAFVSHTSSTGGNAFTVEAKLPSEDIAKYRIGMNGNAEIVLRKKENVLTVPIASIINDHFVYVKTKKGYEKRDLTLGIQSDTDAEVLSGVIEGEKVVLEPSKVPGK